MPNAEDHNGFRLDAIADNIRPHGHKLASLAARPVALRESLQAFTCRHKTGHKTRRRNGRILPIVDPDRIKVAPGAGCPKHIASGRRSGVPSDEVRRFAPSELNVLSRRGKRLAANLRRAEFIASSPRLNPSQNRLGADDPARCRRPWPRRPPRRQRPFGAARDRARTLTNNNPFGGLRHSPLRASRLIGSGRRNRGGARRNRGGGIADEGDDVVEHPTPPKIAR